ncbi:predicted membrane protein [Zymobacter palmae]|uniref:Predicted membrane protein n=3 Tax=Zymobacter palmae TaxID=33074 RepID=A0A348HI16_9GAMM|nr:predicted membrane protein [Zymobacter palmae]
MAREESRLYHAIAWIITPKRWQLPIIRYVILEKLQVNQDPMACSFLDIVKAVEAYLNGEPGMVVVWMGASATISAISGILAFYALNAWWSFGITLVLAVITIALAILTMQELTLPQRLWVHRSVFGRPNHNYYNSIPFGGDKPRSLPNDPAAADEWKDYQRRALNEEAQALGMLVTGITLEVNVYKANPVGKAGEAYDCMQRMNGVPISINISIPQNIDGVLQLEIIEKDYHEELVNDTEHQKTNEKWRYIKQGE